MISNTAITLATIFLFVLLVDANVPGKYFDHIFIVQFENHAYDEVIKDPNFTKYRNLGTIFTDYYAVTHPSQPNYWCQVSGDYYKINSDNLYNLNYTNLVDLMDPKGVTWKAYEEDYPGNCFAGEISGKYYRKHNPFISFNSVRTNATRCSNIVNSQQLDTDLANGDLPNYSYFTPNIDNDGHNTNIAYAGKWLDSFFTPRLSKFPANTIFVVTWDEDDYTEENKIDTFVFGSTVKKGGSDNKHYTHYSLLRTVEDNWSLGTLGRNDANAAAFDIFSK
eukprot:TRINITY_DN1951_c0_g1_i5.p1 TRINITY_DN1951_c0_g1~~TRINITY_DN1951_c0_g1_i5.p1  ORF type:complete len:278 (+),score=47.89 TRINITY_DN1951_c0_g1_i5:87-920(+)